MHIAAVIPKKNPEEVPPPMQALLWDMVMRAYVELDEIEKCELMLMLLNYADLFSNHQSNFGHTTKLHQKIFTGSTAPIYEPLFHASPLVQRD